MSCVGSARCSVVSVCSFCAEKCPIKKGMETRDKLAPHGRNNQSENFSNGRRWKMETTARQ